MIRAIQFDTKTQTRRVVKFGGAGTLRAGTPELPPCPYGGPGDRLRVKEAAWLWCERVPNGLTPTGRSKWLYVALRDTPVHYAADHPQRPKGSVVSPATGNQWGWRLKIGRFLPGWASRITLVVVDVRAERLQDISEADALAEGIVKTHSGFGLPDGSHYHATDPRISYWSLWDAINGAGATESNPLVWRIEFRKAA